MVRKKRGWEPFSRVSKTAHARGACTCVRACVRVRSAARSNVRAHDDETHAQSSYLHVCSVWTSRTVRVVT